MAVSLSRIKFKGLTDFTGNSDYLKYGSSNEYQNANTPYEATYQLNFDNHGTNYQHYLTRASNSILVPSSTYHYVGLYKITNISFSITKPLQIKISNGPLNILNLLCLNPPTQFRSNQYAQVGAGTPISDSSGGGPVNPGTIKYGSGEPFIIPQEIDGFLPTELSDEISLLFVPTAGCYGYVKYSVKFIDKYLITNSPS
jgi:hypothetical protein